MKEELFHEYIVAWSDEDPTLWDEVFTHTDYADAEHEARAVKRRRTDDATYCILLRRVAVARGDWVTVSVDGDTVPQQRPNDDVGFSPA